MIPKERFDEVNKAKKTLETQLTERDTQLEELKKVDAEGLQNKIF
ncbi:phage scaffolding protein [Lysinibacillus sp. ZYM-1]|nr:phage scaffolding protein [Lysinibacillus sp. ZYM-1]